MLEESDKYMFHYVVDVSIAEVFIVNLDSHFNTLFTTTDPLVILIKL